MNELIISKEKWGYLQSVGRWSPTSDEMQRKEKNEKSHLQVPNTRPLKQSPS